MDEVSARVLLEMKWGLNHSRKDFNCYYLDESLPTTKMRTMDLIGCLSPGASKDSFSRRNEETFKRDDWLSGKQSEPFLPSK